MTENQRKPVIRFAEFTDAWEQRKLGDISKIKTGSSDAQDAALEGEYPFFVRSDEIQHSNKYLYDGEAILIPGEGRLGEIYHYINGKFDFHQRVYKISDFDDTNGRFILYEMQRSFKHHALKNTAKATVDSIRLPTLTEYEMQIPSIEEQGLIGTYFKHLDNVITLHQREYDKIVNLKKAMLEKMFPKNGEDRPEIRFKGFTDAWEQRKLKDLCDLFTDGDWIEAKDQSDLGIRLIQTGNIGVTEFIDKNDNAKWISKETFDKLHCEKVFPGDILISRLPEPAGRACVVPTMGTEMITAVDCTIVRTAHDCSNIFLIQFLSTQGYFNDVNAALAGGTRQRISRSNLASFSVLTPSLNEQEAIGTFLNYFDNLITLHQRELKKLQNMKKALLEKMFVQG
jgi:type I restriction enzyme S subunit